MLLLAVMFPVLGTKLVIAQNNFDITYKSIQSPNAYALGKFADVPVSKYTGIPNISIPLTQLGVGNFSLPK